MPRDWRDRGLWHPIGYALTAAWMLVVVVVTESDPAHPFFDTIFIVPITGWILGLAIARLIGRRPRPPE
jgi:hypothetical protein